MAGAMVLFISECTQDPSPAYANLSEYPEQSKKRRDQKQKRLSHAKSTKTRTQEPHRYASTTLPSISQPNT